jgi:hypothetical protein
MRMGNNTNTNASVSICSQLDLKSLLTLFPVAFQAPMQPNIARLPMYCSQSYLNNTEADTRDLKSSVLRICRILCPPVLPVGIHHRALRPLICTLSIADPQQQRTITSRKLPSYNGGSGNG